MLPVSQELLHTVAQVSGMTNIEEFSVTLANSIIPNGAKPAEISAFLAIASQYKLNPITKEIYAFPNRGGIQPIVSIDGWLKIINSHPQFNGMEFIDQLDGNGKLCAVTCRIYRKDREHPTEMTEYMEECKRNTDPWKQWPNRMLRHKATIQAARYAFGFSGIIDPDEAERTASIPSEPVNITPTVLASQEQLDTIYQLAQQADKDPAKIAAAYSVARVEELSAEHAADAIRHLNKAIARLQAEAQAQQPQNNDEIPL